MRLEVTKQCDLAIQAILLLDQSGEKMKSGEIGDAIGSTAGFMAHVLRPLVKKNWIRSDPGPTGGYSLVISLDGVSVLDVVEAIEGPTENGKCVIADFSCSQESPCALHNSWTKARTQLLRELSGISLSKVQFWNQK